MSALAWRVQMHSRPSPGRVFYDGHVDVWSNEALDEEEIGRRARQKAARTHGHADFMIESITPIAA